MPTGVNAVGAPTFTTSGSWANLGYIAPHEFDLGSTNALTVINVDGQQGMVPRADRTRIGTLFRENPELFVSAANPGNYYTSFIANTRNFRQTVTSGYTMANARITRQFQLQAGVRMEETVNELKEFDPRTRAEVIAAGFPVTGAGDAAGRATTIPGLQYQYESKPRITRETKYHNWFPSIQAKYKILPNLEWQAGFNKAISRPPIDDLTGLRVFREDSSGAVFEVEAPNPNLQPEYSKNYQTRLAYYFGSRMPGQLSLQLSQNDIKNLREEVELSAADFGELDPELQDYIFIYTRNSDERRRFRNLELAYRQTLGFLPDILRGTSVNIAYTRTYASQRRARMAPYRLTTRLDYSYRRFGGSIGMVHKPDTPWATRYGYYQREITQFDLTLSWRFHRLATLFVQGRNITGKPVIWYDTAPGEVEGIGSTLRDYQEYGANWVFGVKGTF